MAQSFGQVIPVLGAGVGFPGNVSRTGERVIAARPVLSTSTNPLSFGAGAVLIGSATGGSWQSFADFLATAANAQNLAAYFAGVAVRNVKTQGPFTGYQQATAPTVVTTTMTQATVGSTTIVVVSATGIVTGQSIEGAGIAPNTLVVSISSTTITISLATIAAIPALTNVSFTSSTAPTVGSFAQGTIGEVLERGSVTVVITNGTPQADGPVYVRTVANAALPLTSVGDFEASNDVATTTPTIGVTAGSTTLTTSTGTGIAIGQQITGPGIANNTTIVSGSGTTWVMSQPALYTIASGGAASFNNTLLIGSLVDPWMVFRTGQIDSSNMSEITIKSRHAA